MLSICIPVYNFNVVKLVKELYQQAQSIDEQIEIVLIDDASEDKWRIVNQPDVSKISNYIELNKNIGRAAIRNLFLMHTKNEYLLFLDCDAIVHQSDFLSKYIKAIKSYPKQIFCGGRVYNDTPPNRSKKLRWKYGILKESKSYVERQKQPNKSFMTNNFVIKRELFEQVKFDERLKDYGHEDTLFGFELKEKGIEIQHIDNPILNGHLETNIIFIENTEKAVNNLKYILKYTNNSHKLINEITLLKTSKNVKPIKGIIKGAFFLTKPIIKFFLTKGYVSLFWFNFYKLGTYIQSPNPE